MIRFSFLLIGFVALVLVMFSTRAQAGQVDLYQGKIASIEAKSIMLVSRRGENLAFTVGPNCMILLDGKQVPLSTLGVGNTVRISATFEGGVRLAKEISAQSY